VEILKSHTGLHETASVKTSSRVVSLNEIAKRAGGDYRKHNALTEKSAFGKDLRRNVAEKGFHGANIDSGESLQEDKQYGLNGEAVLPFIAIGLDKHHPSLQFRLDLLTRPQAGEGTTAAVVGYDVSGEEQGTSAKPSSATEPPKNHDKTGLSLDYSLAPLRKDVETSLFLQTNERNSTNGSDNLIPEQRSFSELIVAATPHNAMSGGETPQPQTKTGQSMLHLPQNAAPKTVLEMENSAASRGGTLTYRFANGHNPNAASVDNSVQISLQSATVLKPSNALTYANLSANQSESSGYQLMPVDDQPQQRRNRQDQQDQQPGEDQ
jgi:hypothetical protein